jgi:Transcriptional regulator/sugar kinase
MIKNKAIGVDVGGTKMHFALIGSGKVIKELRLSTDAYGSQEAVLEDLKKGVGELMDDTVIGVGVGVPGLVDPSRGIVHNVQNIPAWKNVPIQSTLESCFNVPVRVGNDANCFALGVKFFGKGFSFSDVIGMTMGTGLGAGVVINDNLYVGNQSIAGEFGGIRYLDATYEDYCSGKFFNRNYDHDALYYSQKAAEGDAEALEIYRQFGLHVGEMLKTVMLSFGPQAIIFGGSLSKAFPYFKGGMDESLAAFPHQHVVKSTLIGVSDNPSMAVLGAASLIFSIAAQLLNE